MFFLFCTCISYIIFVTFLWNMFKPTNGCLHFWTIKQLAKRNLAVSITYREWLGRLYGLLPSLVHHLRTLKPLGSYAAVALLSPLFCSRKAAHDWMIEIRTKIYHTLLCKQIAITLKELECEVTLCSHKFKVAMHASCMQMR